MTMTDIFIDKFRGIREQNPVCEVVSSGQMSAVLSQNVELEFSQNGDHVGIRTVKGDTLAFSLPDVIAANAKRGISPSMMTITFGKLHLAAFPPAFNCLLSPDRVGLRFWRVRTPVLPLLGLLSWYIRILGGLGCIY